MFCYIINFLIFLLLNGSFTCSVYIFITIDLFVFYLVGRLRDANDRHVDAKSFLEDEKEVEEEVEEQSDDESEVESSHAEKMVKTEKAENSQIIEMKEKSKWRYFLPLLKVFLNFSNA